MNIKDYISSGVLESYLLGELSASARKDVEHMAENHPEVKEELRRIESTLYSLALSAAVEPSNEVKGKVMADLGAAEKDGIDPISSAKPLSSQRKMVPSPTYKFMLAAAIAIAILSSIVAISYYNKYKSIRNELASVLAQNVRLAENIQQASQQLTAVKEDFNILNDSSIIPVPMKGLEVAPNALAVVHWNHHSNEVYLNVKHLPEPSPGKQYQLWAIVDGKPVDAGVFDMEEAVNGLVRMKDIEGASAFAVTLEPQGGSKSPTLEAMVVMGQVKT